jgi:hypothetical protein
VASCEEIDDLPVAMAAFWASVAGLIRMGTGDVSDFADARRSAKLGVPLEASRAGVGDPGAPSACADCVIVPEPWRPERRASANPGLQSGALGKVPCLLLYSCNNFAHLRNSLTRAAVHTACIVWPDCPGPRAIAPRAVPKGLPRDLANEVTSKSIPPPRGAASEDSACRCLSP